LDKQGAVYLSRLLLQQIPLLNPVERAGDPCAEFPAVPGFIPSQQRLHLGFFDLETQRLAEEVGGWGNKHLMRLSVGVLYDTREDRFYDYGEKEVKGLIDHLKRFDLVVGFNVKSFDYGVLKGYSSFDFGALPTLDLLEDIFSVLGFRLSLDHLGLKTLGKQKSGNGLLAVQWFREGQFELLTEYCRQDVALTKALFEFGADKGHVLFESKGGQVVRCPVDWTADRVRKISRKT
jgi:DEAD/DEAH box helicase domain-containing protein